VESGWIVWGPRVGTGLESRLDLVEESKPFEPKRQYEIGKIVL